MTQVGVVDVVVSFLCLLIFTLGGMFLFFVYKLFVRIDSEGVGFPRKYALRPFSRPRGHIIGIGVVNRFGQRYAFVISRDSAFLYIGRTGITWIYPVPCYRFPLSELSIELAANNKLSIHLSNKLVVEIDLLNNDLLTTNGNEMPNVPSCASSTTIAPTHFDLSSRLPRNSLRGLSILVLLLGAVTAIGLKYWQIAPGLVVFGIIMTEICEKLLVPNNVQFTNDWQGVHKSGGVNIVIFVLSVLPSLLIGAILVVIGLSYSVALFPSGIFLGIASVMLAVHITLWRRRETLRGSSIAGPPPM